MRSYRSCSHGLQWLVIAVVAIHSMGAAEDEAGKRRQFLKDYMVKDKEARRAAVQSLTGCSQRQTLGLLARVVASDKEPEVRQEAFRVLAACPEETSGASALLVQCFRLEKDKGIKQEVLQLVGDRKLKFAWINELVRFLSSECSYPHIPDDVSERGPNGNTFKKYEKQRAMRGDFHNVVLTINAMTGQKFTSTNKTAAEIRAWWAANGAKYQKADRELEKQWKEAAKAKK